jgi:hypothetical protein
MLQAILDHMTCPRCGWCIPDDDRPGEYPGAISRTDNVTEICSLCGDEEAYEWLASMPADHASPEGRSCQPQSSWIHPKRVAS